MKTPKICCLLTAIALAQSSLFGVSTDPVGFVSISVPAASDAALGAPLSRASEFKGVVQSISGSVITIAGSPNWNSNQFVYVAGVQSKTYFLQIDSESKEGLVLPITGNGSNTLTVEVPAQDDLSGILTVANDGNGSQVSIIPYWTPKSLIGNVTAGTQLLRYPSSTPGTNLAPIAYAYNGTNWRLSGNTVDDVVLLPNEGFVIRNNSTLAQTISITGSVPMTGYRVRLYTLLAGSAQDQRIFYNSPIPEAIGSAFTGVGLTAGDRILAFDNSSVGKNKSPVEQLVWNGTQWRKDGVNVSTTYMLQPGTSYIFRKAQSASPSSSLVTDLQSYLQ